MRLCAASWQQRRSKPPCSLAPTPSHLVTYDFPPLLGFTACGGGGPGRPINEPGKPGGTFCWRGLRTWEFEDLLTLLPVGFRFAIRSNCSSSARRRSRPVARLGKLSGLTVAGFFCFIFAGWPALDPAELEEDLVALPPAAGSRFASCGSAASSARARRASATSKAAIRSSRERLHLQPPWAPAGVAVLVLMPADLTDCCAGGPLGLRRARPPLSFGTETLPFEGFVGPVGRLPDMWPGWPPLGLTSLGSSLLMEGGLSMEGGCGLRLRGSAGSPSARLRLARRIWSSGACSWWASWPVTGCAAGA